MEKVMELSTAAIAFGTILGMAGAIGTFLLQLGLSSLIAVTIPMIYIFASILFVSWLRRTIE